MPDIVGMSVARAASVLAAAGILVDAWKACLCGNDKPAVGVAEFAEALVCCTEPPQGEIPDQGSVLVGVRLRIEPS